MVEIRRGLERRVAKRSRRSDVFSDLIEKNYYQGVYRKKKAEIQRILKNYTIMDAKTRKALQEFGFRIEEECNALSQKILNYKTPDECYDAELDRIYRRR